MRITEVNQITGFIVVTDETDQNEYIRLSRGNWLVRMGESWETCYDSEELEKLLLNLILKD